jgi:hypothetical protein
VSWTGLRWGLSTVDHGAPLRCHEKREKQDSRRGRLDGNGTAALANVVATELLQDRNAMDTNTFEMILGLHLMPLIHLRQNIANALRERHGDVSLVRQGDQPLTKRADLEHLLTARVLQH